MNAALPWRLPLVLALLSVPAAARGPRYAGPHPVASSVAATPTWCHLEAPHVHSYAPDRGALYAQTPEGLLFTADPTPFGYRGPTHVYVGNHPVPGPRGAVCYLEGPHRHAFAPERAAYQVLDGAAFYVGEMEPEYARERAVRIPAYQLAYAPFAADRPVVSVEPPSAWRARPWGAATTAAPATPPAAGAAPATPGAQRPDGGAR